MLYKYSFDCFMNVINRIWVTFVSFDRQIQNIYYEYTDRSVVSHTVLLECIWKQPVQHAPINHKSGWISGNQHRKRKLQLVVRPPAIATHWQSIAYYRITIMLYIYTLTAEFDTNYRESTYIE